MVRKTKEDSELTHAALLDAAERVFFDKGVARATLNDIAQAAGVTRGAVYWHFKDKADVMQALFSRAMLPMEAMMVDLDICAESDPLAALRYMCVHALTTLAQSESQQRIFSIMFHKCENVGELMTVMDDKNANCEECLARVARLLTRAVSAGQLPADTDVFIAHQALNAFMAGAMREWLQAPATYALDRAAPAMVDMILTGLRSNPPRLAAGPDSTTPPG
jgi:TetR/AcrR family acrAB operon transcriptional repressor